MSQAPISNLKTSGTSEVASGSLTVKSGASLVSEAGSTVDISAGTVTLPSDVTRLGSSIDLSGAEVTGALPWSGLNKTGSTLADLATRSASDLATGTVAVARLPALVGDSGSGGTAGIVPAPAAGDAAAKKLLGAGGAWADADATKLQGRALASDAPSDGQSLIWDAAQSRWEPGGVAGDAVTIQGRAVASAAPADTQVLVWNAGASQWEPDDQSGTGGGTTTAYQGLGVLQTEIGSDATHRTLSTAIPVDDTIPQNTEGDEIMTVAITPKSPDSMLLVTVSVVGAYVNAANQVISAALFKDTEADALAVGAAQGDAASHTDGITFVYSEASSSLTERTFKVRVGPNTGTAFLHGNNSSRRFGGVQKSIITVTEVLEQGVNLTLRATTRTLRHWTPLEGNPPAANPATSFTRNSIPVLQFDADTQESTNFIFRVPENAKLSSGLRFFLEWMAESATSGNVVWGVQLMNMNTDLDADSYDSAVEGTSGANGTSGITTITEIDVTSALDGIVEGSLVWVNVYRKAAAAGDTMTGDAQLVSFAVESIAEPDSKAGVMVGAIVAESTTARSLTVADIGKYIRLTHASPCTITIPTDASAGWDLEDFPPVIFFRVTAGIPVISNAGVTLNDPLAIEANLVVGSTFALQYVGANEWDLV